MPSEPVTLNVYDMYWTNGYTTPLGFGVYHSGIEVYGVEYAFGGHPYDCSGIFEIAPKDSQELGENFKLKESSVVGTTDFGAEDIAQIIRCLGEKYHGKKYHLFNKNCNHFTNELSQTLCGKEIPPWVNRLASVTGYMPFIERLLPKEWITPHALQEALDHRTQAS